MDYLSLLRDAAVAAEASYSPYSNFAVGAALLAVDGHVFSGTNVENASFGATICAERSALVMAVSQGHRSFRAIAVVCGQGSKIFTPCGICRQSLAEFAPDLDVYCSSFELLSQEKYKKFALKHLLTEAFIEFN